VDVELAGLSLDSFEVTQARVWTFVVLLSSVALHESAHAYVASWCGDPTPGLMGRKTLNPLRHLDPLMSVLVPAFVIFGGFPFIFGAGKPVVVRPLAMRVPDRDGALVALAGPAANALLLVVFTVTYVLLKDKGLATTAADPASSTHAMVAHVMQEGMFLNLLLMIFNLIPIPPLDGSRIVAYLLPSGLKPLWFRLDVVGFLVLIVLLYTGTLGTIFRAVYVPARDWWIDLYTHW